MSITDTTIKKYREDFASDKIVKLSQNVITGNSGKLQDVVVDREIVQSTTHEFSIKLDKWSVTNQKASGRCWLFALLNFLRPEVMKELDLKDFEFSQAHIHFWDKFERSNYFLESMIDLKDVQVEDRTIQWMFSDCVSDGGQWNMAINLIKKHGLVPKSAYPESFSSSSTGAMNMVLKDILRSTACEIRKMSKDGKSLEDIRKHKSSRLAEIWKILCVHLGTPPEKFDWQWRSKADLFTRAGEMTPLDFVKNYVKTDFESMIALVNDPRNEYMKTYTVDRLQNVYGGDKVIYLNVETSVMKDITKRMLQDGIPVWMGCDVGKQMHRWKGLWDNNLYDFKSVYNISEFGMNKADRLRHGATLMTHAMLFTGVDIDDDGKPTKWRVENSWGSENSGINGFYTMNDNWYDEHMFEIAAPPSYLTPGMLEAVKLDPIMLPAYDPMGALATCEAMSDE